MATKIEWAPLSDANDFVGTQRLASIRTDGGDATIWASDEGEYMITLLPDGPAGLPTMFGGKFLHYSDAIEAVMVDVRQSEVDAL